VIIVQNLVLNIGDWTELHGICVLKTAPKVSKRKTMLIHSIGILTQNILTEKQHQRNIKKQDSIFTGIFMFF